MRRWLALCLLILLTACNKTAPPSVPAPAPEPEPPPRAALPRVEAFAAGTTTPVEPGNVTLVRGEADGFHLRFIFEQAPPAEEFSAALRLEPGAFMQPASQAGRQWLIPGRIPAGERLTVTYAGVHYTLESRPAPKAEFRLRTADGRFVTEGGPVPAGEVRFRLVFSEPMERTGVEKALRQDLQPEAVEWDPDSQGATVTYRLAPGKAVGLSAAGMRTADGAALAEPAHISVWARGEATLWRLDPGGTARPLARLLDRFESLFAAPGGEALLLYSTQEWGYMDFVKTFFADPNSGAVQETAVPVNDMQAPPPPRWWQGGAVVAGVTWGVNRLDWQGNLLAPPPGPPEGLVVRGSGVSPGGRVAILVSPWPERGKQPPVDLVVGEQVFRAVSRLPMWPENRADTHYWPHVQLLWLSESSIVFRHLDPPRTWGRLDLASGKTETFPLLSGFSEAYPSPDGRSFLARNEAGWALVAPGRPPVDLALPADAPLSWAPPAWSADGTRVHVGPHDVDAGSGQVRDIPVPRTARAVARDAAGRAYWLQSEP